MLDFIYKCWMVLLVGGSVLTVGLVFSSYGAAFVVVQFWIYLFIVTDPRV